MSYLGRPSRRSPVHIPDQGGNMVTGSREGDDLALLAECGETFPRPDRNSWWVPITGRRVCKHCARMARHRAIRLLQLAEGAGR